MYEEYDDEEFGMDDYGYDDDEDSPYHHRHHVWSSSQDASLLENEFEKYDGLSTPSQLLHNCIAPTFQSASSQLAETFVLCAIYRVLISFDRVKTNPFYRNYLNVFVGLAILYRYFHTLIIYVCVYSVCLTLVHCACKRSRHLFNVILGVSIGTITICEYTFVRFIQIRSVFMLMSAKVLSLCVDFSSSNCPLTFDVLAYLFNPGTVLFGPFVTYEQYVRSLTSKTLTRGGASASGSVSIWAQLWSLLKHLICAGAFLLCTCLVMVFPTYSSRSLYMYRDALGFRVSHYFISALSVCTFVICGYEWFERTGGGAASSEGKRRTSVSVDDDVREDGRGECARGGKDHEEELVNEREDRVDSASKEMEADVDDDNSIGTRFRSNRSKNKFKNDAVDGSRSSAMGSKRYLSGDKSKNVGVDGSKSSTMGRKRQTNHLNERSNGTDVGSRTGDSNFYEMVSNPLYIEFPISLKNVVFHWNRPLSFFLNHYIYRRFHDETAETRNQNVAFYSKNKFMRLFSTYFVSCGLHGFNVDICVILFSLSVYSYVEYELRAKLAATFSACVGSGACASRLRASGAHAQVRRGEEEGEDCGHAHKASSCLSVCVNGLFVAMNVYHLAYLGCLMHETEFREPWMIVYFALPLKWVRAGFASHYVVLAQYLFYILI